MFKSTFFFRPIKHIVSIIFADVLSQQSKFVLFLIFVNCSRPTTSKIIFQQLASQLSASAQQETTGHQSRASHQDSRASRGDKTSAAGLHLLVPSSVELECTEVEDLGQVKSSELVDPKKEQFKTNFNAEQS